MTLTTRLSNTLHIRAGEGHLVARVLGYGFALGLGRLFCGAAVSGMFLNVFGARSLPYAFIGTALLVPLTGLSYLRLQRHMPLARVIALALGLLALALLGFRLALGVSQAPWLVMSLMIGYTTVYVLVSLSFWGLVNQLFDVRQGKRLYGLLSAGSETADISGGLLTLVLAPLIGAPNLLLLAAAGLLAALLLERAIVRRYPLGADSAAAADEGPGHSVGAVLAGGYVRLLLVLVACSQLGYFFVENVFYDFSMAHFSGPDQFSALVGATVAASSTLTILLQVAVSSRLLNRFGLLGALPLLPALLAVGAAAVAVAGGLAGPVFAVFVLALIARVAERALRFSVDETAVQIAYQPLPAAQRSLLQTLVDGGVKPLAGGVAGVLILLCTRLLGLGGVAMAGLLALIAVAWLSVAVLLARRYPAALLSALGHRRLSAATLRVDDAESLAVVERSLRSRHAGEALYALQLLEDLEHAALPTALATLLGHPEPNVRREALRKIERAPRPELRAPVAALLRGEGEPPVRGQALRALDALGALSPEQAAAALTEPHPDVRLGAVVALGRSGHAASWLRAWAGSADPAERELAARAIGELRSPDGAELIAPLLSDASLPVRQAAFAAVGAAGAEALWPQVVAALMSSPLRAAALASLLAGGSSALRALDETIGNQELPMALRLQAARAAGKLGPDAGALLAARIGTTPEELRHGLAAAIEQSGYRAMGPAAEGLWAAVRVEAALTTWLLAARRDLDDAPVYAALNTALASAALRARERVLNLLGALVDPQALRQARAGLARGADQQAYAIEALDLMLPQAARALVLPLVERQEVAAALRALESHFPQERRTGEERIAEILAGDAARHHPWVHVCAASVARTAGALPATALFERVQLLKGSTIFAGAPAEDLLGVAELLQHVELPAGALIFARGDPGSCAYLIVSGSVQIHKGPRVLNRLGPRDMFGELATLDSQPRSLSATALEPTRLLRLDREPLFELITDHIAVARGIIGTLIRNLRTNVRELSALQLQTGAELAAQAPQPARDAASTP
jgi:AAA family ATP:ADP antiporter